MFRACGPSEVPVATTPTNGPASTCESCDVLVAIGCYQPSRGVGGTGEILELARRRGMPAYVIDSGSPSDVTEERFPNSFALCKRWSATTDPAPVERYRSHGLVPASTPDRRQPTSSLPVWAEPGFRRRRRHREALPRRFLAFSRLRFLLSAIATFAVAVSVVADDEGIQRTCLSGGRPDGRGADAGWWSAPPPRPLITVRASSRNGCAHRRPRVRRDRSRDGVHAGGRVSGHAQEALAGDPGDWRSRPDRPRTGRSTVLSSCSVSMGGSSGRYTGVGGEPRHRVPSLAATSAPCSRPRSSPQRSMPPSVSMATHRKPSAILSIALPASPVPSQA